eukprot:Rmarinus@m.2432
MSVLSLLGWMRLASFVRRSVFAWSLWTISSYTYSVLLDTLRLTLPTLAGPLTLGMTLYIRIIANLVLASERTVASLGRRFETCNINQGTGGHRPVVCALRAASTRTRILSPN